MGRHAPGVQESFWRHLLRAVPVIVAVTLLVHLLHHGVWFHSYGAAMLDTLLLLKKPRLARHVVIVGIDDEDYLELFKATSPLDVQQLQRLIDAIAAGNPRLIGIDIDTSAPEFANLAVPTPIESVWARDARLSIKESGDGGHGEGESFLPLSVRGGRKPESLVGVALLPQDADGVARRYRRVFPTVRGEVPSFAYQAVLAARGGKQDPGSSNEDLLLNFAGDRMTFNRTSAKAVLSGARGDMTWRDKGPLNGKIVLLGGVYRAARDEYVTPLGPMAGVELHALAIESELERGGIRPANQYLMITLDILFGICLVGINYRALCGHLSLLAALVASLIAIPVLALLASLIALSTLAYWMNAVPLLAAVFIHQLYDHANHYRKLHLQERAGKAPPVQELHAPAIAEPDKLIAPQAE